MKASLRSMQDIHAYTTSIQQTVALKCVNPNFQEAIAKTQALLIAIHCAVRECPFQPAIQPMIWLDAETTIVKLPMYSNANLAGLYHCCLYCFHSLSCLCYSSVLRNVSLILFRKTCLLYRFR